MSNELEKVEKELVDVKAKMQALEAVLDEKKIAPEGVDATLFNRYKKFPEAQARTMVVGLQTTIGALEEQKARLGPTLDLLAQQPKSDVPQNNNDRCRVFLTQLAHSDMALLLHLLDEIAMNETKKGEETFCVPDQVAQTWGEASLRKELNTTWELLRGGILDAGAPRVAATVSGSGNGKTHALLAMPALLNCDGVYHTYNLEQDLSADADHPQASALFRIVLRLFGLAHYSIASYIHDNHDLLSSSLVDKLVDVAAAKIEQRIQEQEPKDPDDVHFLISMDECRKLYIKKKDAVLLVASAVGELVYKLRVAKRINCLAVLSCLSSDCLISNSGRQILLLRLPVADELTREFLYENLVNKNGLCDVQMRNRHMAMITACGGNHMRSIVVACNFLADERTELEPNDVYLRVQHRLRSTFAPEVSSNVRKYIIAALSSSADANYHALAASHNVSELIDSTGAICPALAHFAFQDDSLASSVSEMFKCSIFVPPPKQLELIGYSFDRLRCNLLVIPPKCADSLVIPSGRGQAALREWFLKLKLPLAFNVVKESLFKTVDKTVVLNTELQLSPGDYLLPDCDQHPHIDRAVMMEHIDGGECLVLYQDKIGNKMPEAVDGLTAAHSLLKGCSWVENILLVAHVVGATGRSQAQNRLRTVAPFLTIREDELDTFYSPTFAPHVRFVKLRYADVKDEVVSFDSVAGRTAKRERK